MPYSRFSQFHLNQRMAAAPAKAVQSSRIRVAPPLKVPARKASRRASPSAPEGRKCTSSCVGPGKRSAGMTMPPRAPSRIQSRLVMASVASGRTVPATRSPSAVKAAAPRTRSPSAGTQPAAVGCQPSSKRHRADHQDLEEQHGQNGQDLAGDQSGPAQRSGGQEPQHTIAAVEAGGDALAGEGGGHGAQGEDAWNRNVNAATAEAVQERGDRQADQGHQRQDDGEDQLLAVPQHGESLVFALKQNAAEQWGGRAAENPAHRISLPEMSKNTSSRLRASRLMEPGMMPCAAHQAVSAARSCGVSAPVTA